MRLLNILTNAVEEHDFANAPPYAAVSYLWPAAAAAPDAATRKEQQQQVVVPWSSAALITAARDSSGGGAHLSTVPFSSVWPIPSCTPAALNDALAAIYAARAAVLDADDGQPKQPAAPRPAPHFTHLWMDVLCIPQDSDAHKAAEVAVMGAYYSRAACVWVFLDVLGKPALPLKPHGAVVARWFTRLWTLQECVLPSKLFFLVPAGTKTQAEGTATATTRLVTPSNGSTAALHVNADAGIASDPLQGGQWVSRIHLIAVLWMTASSMLVGKTLPASHQFRVALQLLPLTVRKASVRTALLLSSVRECRYPVDRLYGILGLLPRDRPDVFNADKVVVDYQKPFEQVAAEFAEALGPAVVKSFSLVSLAPLEHDDDEEGTDAPRAKSDATATATTTTSANTLSWFGGFQPGLFVAGGTRLLRTNREHEEFLSKDDFSAADYPPFRIDAARGARFTRVDVNPLVTPTGVLLRQVPVVQVSTIDCGEPAFFTKDNVFYSESVAAMAAGINANPALLAWARKQVLATAAAAAADPTATPTSPKQTIFSRARAALTTAAQHATALAEAAASAAFRGYSAGGQIAYPQPLCHASAASAGRTRTSLTGIAGDASRIREAVDAARQIVLVLAGSAVGNDFDDPLHAFGAALADVYAVCVVVGGGGDAGENDGEGRPAPLVVKKVATFHVFRYGDAAAGEVEAASPPPIVQDFAVMDVLVT